MWVEKNETAIGSESWNIWSPHAARPSTKTPKAHRVGPTMCLFNVGF